jgi:hypothetical protein
LDATKDTSHPALNTEARPNGASQRSATIDARGVEPLRERPEWKRVVEGSGG